MNFRCSVCGYIYEGQELPDGYECPVCHQIGKFEEYSDPKQELPESDGSPKVLDLNYDPLFARQDESCRYMKEIHEMAVSGKFLHSSMGTQMKMPNWDDILILGAQLNPLPLDDGEPVNTTTIIGKHAKKPLVIENPVFISHMSFGALSKETKTALAKGSAIQEFMLYDMTTKPEYEANIVAAEILLDTDEILEYIYDYGYTSEQIARAMGTDINLVALKIAHLAESGYDLRRIEHRSDFLK